MDILKRPDVGSFLLKATLLSGGFDTPLRGYSTTELD
jgi:hypothetical protein